MIVIKWRSLYKYPWPDNNRNLRICHQSLLSKSVNVTDHLCNNFRIICRNVLVSLSHYLVFYTLKNYIYKFCFCNLDLVFLPILPNKFTSLTIVLSFLINTPFCVSLTVALSASTTWSLYSRKLCTGFVYNVVFLGVKVNQTYKIIPYKTYIIKLPKM